MSDSDAVKSLDAALDELYGVAPDEFVAARKQLAGDLLRGTAVVLDEYENLSHGDTSQISFCDARNSAILVPPSPSSLTF